MLVRDIGEVGLIDTLARSIRDRNAAFAERFGGCGFGLRLSIGDDAAAWDSPSGLRVMTTDTMVEGVHFDLGQIRWRDLGWKALAVNLSDIASMGCAPLYSVVTLGLRGDLPVDGLLEMYQGLLDACERCGGAVVGGDIVKSPVFFVTVALEGTAAAGKDDDPSNPKILTRHSARPGDQIGVTGNLGCSAGGLKVLTSTDLPKEGDVFHHLRDAHHRPMPRVSQGMELARHGVLAAMDISDGLVEDLSKMCKASEVGAVIRGDSVPADDILRDAFPEHWLELALGGGEDYELLFTAPSELMSRVASALDVEVSVIGEVVEGPPGVRVLDRHGNDVSIERGGWDHFPT